LAPFLQKLTSIHLTYEFASPVVRFSLVSYLKKTDVRAVKRCWARFLNCGISKNETKRAKFPPLDSELPSFSLTSYNYTKIYRDWREFTTPEVLIAN
jgi:hypothetical protein